MNLKWYLDEKDFEEYKMHQHDDYGEYNEGDYIGSVRTGNICYDILSWEKSLWFDLYVGGVDTGYGYSDRDGFEDYPYDFCDVYSFEWDKDLKDTSIEDFEKEVSEYIKKYISENDKYVTDMRAIPVNILEKANEELCLW